MKVGHMHQLFGVFLRPSVVNRRCYIVSNLMHRPVPGASSNKKSLTWSIAIKIKTSCTCVSE